MLKNDSHFFKCCGAVAELSNFDFKSPEPTKRRTAPQHCFKEKFYNFIRFTSIQLTQKVSVIDKEILRRSDVVCPYLQRLAAEVKSKGGILIPEKGQKKGMEATVVAVGTGARQVVIRIDRYAATRNRIFGIWTRIQAPKIYKEKILFKNTVDICSNVLAIALKKSFYVGFYWPPQHLNLLQSTQSSMFSSLKISLLPTVTNNSIACYYFLLADMLADHQKRYFYRVKF